MFTVCPKCTLTLAVTANDLRLGQGYVRCGRCANVFNALLKLSESPGGGAAVIPVAQADPASASQITRALSGASPESAPLPGAPARPPSSPTAPAAPARSPSSPVLSARPATATTAPATAAGPPSSSTTAPALAGRPSASGMTARTSPPPPAAPAIAPAASVAAPSAVAPPSARTAPPSATASSVATAAGPRTPATMTATAAKATSSAPSAAAAPTAAVASRAAAPAVRTDPADAEAIDQFEVVLKTLGLGLEEEPATRSADDATEPADTRTVEFIVLEGDAITQAEATLPQQPLDELDLFTRQLGLVTDSVANAAQQSTAAQPQPALSPTIAADSAPGHPPAPAGSRRSRIAARLERQRAAAAAPTSAAAARARVGSAVMPAASRSGVAGARAAPHAAEWEESSQFDAAALARQLSEASDKPDLDIPGLQSSRVSRTRLWAVGAAVLVLLLLAQAIHHWRAQLATTPLIGAPIGHLYAALGAPIAPHWDLGAYEIHQQGAEASGGATGVIRVRFSLANHAMRAQPLPVLRLTLLDRYGKRLAQRSLQPADYWPHGRPLPRLLGSDERIDTEVEVRDPGADSASFELDVCLPDAQGALHCAGDAGPGSGPL